MGGAALGRGADWNVGMSPNGLGSFSHATRLEVARVRRATGLKIMMEICIVSDQATLRWRSIREKQKKELYWVHGKLAGLDKID